MTIILFLIDTSGSMNQRTHYGARPTLLDVTKETVEKFIKVSAQLGVPVASGRIFTVVCLVCSWHFPSSAFNFPPVQP